MIKYLKELWILQERGILVFSNVLSSEYDDQLLTGFISAMIKVVKTRWNEEFTFFATPQSKFRILRKENLYIVGRFPNQINEKRMNREMTYISDHLPETLWQGDDNKVKEVSELYRILTPKSELIGDFIESLWRDC